MKRYALLTIIFFFITCLAYANDRGHHLFSYFTDEEYANLKSHFERDSAMSLRPISIKENIVSGIPWYDRRDSIVSAHGANIIRENGKYYMFGEFKTDSVNAFKGFSCYSSPDLVNWTFESFDRSDWKGSLPFDCIKYNISIGEKERIYIKGETTDTGGYARIKITDTDGKTMVDTPVDFYSLAPSSGLRYVSPQLPKGNYLMEVIVSDMKSNWSDKKRIVYGSKGHDIIITEIGTIL